MKSLSRVAMSFMLCVSLAGLSVGCASQTTITTMPAGADLKIDGAPAGKTPYNHTEASVWLWTKHQLTFEKAGYMPTSGMIAGELSPTHLVVGLLCCLPVLFVGQYNPQYNFVLSKAGVGGQQVKEVYRASQDGAPVETVKVNFAP